MRGPRRQPDDRPWAKTSPSSSSSSSTSNRGRSSSGSSCHPSHVAPFRAGPIGRASKQAPTKSENWRDPYRTKCARAVLEFSGRLCAVVCGLVVVANRTRARAQQKRRRRRHLRSRAAFAGGYTANKNNLQLHVIVLARTRDPF